MSPRLPSFRARALTSLELCAFARSWREEPALPQNSARKPFKICTSIARPDLRIPKDLAPPSVHSQLLYFPHLQALLLSVGNKRLITPLESALTENSPATPLESALTKKPGGGLRRLRSYRVVRSIVSTVLASLHSQLQSAQSLPHSFPSQRGVGVSDPFRLWYLPIRRFHSARGATC